MPAIVESDDAAAGRGESADPADIAPISRDIGGKAMDQEDGLPFPLVVIGDADAV